MHGLQRACIHGPKGGRFREKSEQFIRLIGAMRTTGGVRESRKEGIWGRRRAHV